MRYLHKGLVRAAALVGLGVILLAPKTEAALMTSDFLTLNDGLLVTDDVTNIQWLSPFFTRGQSYNEVLGGFGDLLTTHDFQFEIPGTVRAMINNNFDNPTTVHPGDVAGFISAANFFNIFGINQLVGCGVPCPRTQGLAVDGAIATQLGMIQFGSTGYMLDFPNTLTNREDTKDLQLGMWLSREIPVPAIPLPAAFPLFGTGLGLLGFLGWRRRRQAQAV